MALHDPTPRYDPLAWSIRGQGTSRFVPRDDNGDLARALERFRAKCRFNPRTGCVEWIGGTTRGRGNTATYGSFWYDGRRWFAHRWAAAFIHGLDIDKLQVGHDCKFTGDGHPNTLCVQHVVGQSQADNLAEQIERGTGAVGKALKADQTAEQRQHWLFTHIGLVEPEPAHDPALPTPDWPDFTPPEWLHPERNR